MSDDQFPERPADETPERPADETPEWPAGEDALLPAIVQDHRDGSVRMLGWMNAEAYARTVEVGRVTFWSRTRGVGPEEVASRLADRARGPGSGRSG